MYHRNTESKHTVHTAAFPLVIVGNVSVLNFSLQCSKYEVAHYNFNINLAGPPFDYSSWVESMEKIIRNCLFISATLYINTTLPRLRLYLMQMS